jgi:hypothetical protein
MSSKAKQDRYEAMVAKVKETHDFAPGQVTQWEACGVCATDVCRICGIRRAWGSGGQNTGSFERFCDKRGESLTLAEAVETSCQ